MAGMDVGRRGSASSSAVAVGSGLGGGCRKQLGHTTASITLDTYGHLFPSELEALAGRLEDARAEALASLARTSGRAVVGRRRSVSGSKGAGGGARTLMPCGPNAFKARLSADSSTPALTCQATGSGPLARGGTSGSVGICVHC